NITLYWDKSKYKTKCLLAHSVVFVVNLLILTKKYDSHYTEKSIKNYSPPRGWSATVLCALAERFDIMYISSNGERDVSNLIDKIIMTHLHVILLRIEIVIFFAEFLIYLFHITLVNTYKVACVFLVFSSITMYMPTCSIYTCTKCVSPHDSLYLVLLITLLRIVPFN
ncbi:hypothetical protein ACJX0J_024775, partial [Zea mays]